MPGSRHYTPEAIRATVAQDRNGLASRPGIISTGASAVGTTQDNTGLAFGTGNLSFGMWVRAPDWTPAAAKILLAKWASSVGFDFYLNTDGVIRLTLAGTGYASTVATGIPDGAWAFLAVVLDRGGNASFYVNGALLGAPVSIAAQSAVTLTSTASLAWGSSSTGTLGLAGTLGETFIVNGLLTATNIADIYRAGSIAPFSASFTFYQWADFGQGYGPIIKDRSGRNQPALMGTSGLTHAVPRNPPGVPQRAPRAALVSDGTTTNFIRSALGSQSPGTGDTTLLWDGVVPAADSTSRILAALSSSSSSIVAPSAGYLFVNTTYGIAFVLYGSAAGPIHWRQKASVLLATLLSGKRATITVRRSSSGLSIFVGVDGELFDATNLFVETVDGAGNPAWTETITGSYLYGAGPTYTNATSLFDLRLANVAMTEAQLRTEYERGEPGLEWSWGSKTPIYSSDFSAGVDGWNGIRIALTGNVDGVSDGSTSYSDVLSVNDNATNSTHVLSRDLSLSLNTGVRYTVSGKLYIPTANVNLKNVAVQVGDTQNGVNAPSNVITQTNIWVAFSYTVTAGGFGTWLNFSTRNAADAITYAGNGTDVFYLRDLVVTRVGYTSRLRTDTAAGLTALDGSSNKNDFLISTSGVTTSPNGRVAIIRDTVVHGGSGSIQIKGASCIDVSKAWRIRSVQVTASAGVNVSLGNVSSGAQYISAQPVVVAADNTTFVTRLLNGANLWSTSNGASTLGYTIILDLVD